MPPKLKMAEQPPCKRQGAGSKPAGGSGCVRQVEDAILNASSDNAVHVTMEWMGKTCTFTMGGARPVIFGFINETQEEISNETWVKRYLTGRRFLWLAEFPPELADLSELREEIQKILSASPPKKGEPDE